VSFHHIFLVISIFHFILWVRIFPYRIFILTFHVIKFSANFSFFLDPIFQQLYNILLNDLEFFILLIQMWNLYFKVSLGDKVFLLYRLFLCIIYWWYNHFLDYLLILYIFLMLLFFTQVLRMLQYRQVSITHNQKLWLNKARVMKLNFQVQ